MARTTIGEGAPRRASAASPIVVAVSTGTGDLAFARRSTTRGLWQRIPQGRQRLAARAAACPAMSVRPRARIPVLNLALGFDDHANPRTAVPARAAVERR